MLKKNVLVILPKEFNEDFREWFGEFYTEDNLKFYYYEDNEGNLDGNLTTADLVFNFLINKKDFSLIQKKIELLKIDFFGNELSNSLTFSEKNNFKKIIEKSNFKTPVFEKIENKNPLELFNNFPRPCRIFSKKNDYFSKKIDSLESMNEVFNLGKNFEDYYIEEFIDGKNFYVTAFENENGEWVISPVEEKEKFFLKVDGDERQKIENEVKDFLENSGLKDFAMFNLIYSKKRGLYFLNIFLENFILFNQRENIEEILEINNYKNLKLILNKNLF